VSAIVNPALQKELKPTQYLTENHRTFDADT